VGLGTLFFFGPAGPNLTDNDALGAFRLTFFKQKIDKENAYFKNNQKNLKQTRNGENAYFKNNQKNLKQTKTKKT